MQSLNVNPMLSTTESAPVYNLEVVEYFTYVFGGGFWGFAV